MYNLHKLGWDSFQRLCLAITREILGQTVESFLNSHDGGRDGAFSGTWNENGKEDLSGKFVIQCKFTGIDGKNLRISDLSDEIRKAKRLVAQDRCDTYVLMTNAGVSGSLDEEIKRRLKAAGVKHARTLGSNWIIEQIVESQRLRTLVPRVYGLGDLSQILDERAYEQSRAVLEFMKEDLAKVVVTDAYYKAVDAINEHGFVLLIGEPAAGKTTIASLLAMAALDQWNSLVLKLDDPKSVVERWNPNEPSQFIWVDDAFGVTQYEDSLVMEWNRNLTSIRTMLSKGAKIVLTSRDYIYNRARQGLKGGAFPLLNESQVVIDVRDLALNEKRQILYNHLKLGNQPKHFRTEIKPYLEGVADHPRFIPEIARRLADPNFTKSLPPTEQELDKFVGKRELFLQQLLEELDTHSKAALALIYMRNGQLESPIDVQPSELKALVRLGSDIGHSRMALEALEGSFVLRSDANDGSIWQFRHPTIGDSYAGILGENPNLIDIFIQGSTPTRLLRQITCGNVGLQNAFVVPKSLYPQVLLKIDEMTPGQPNAPFHRLSWMTKWNLMGFLAARCSRDFLALYLEGHPSFLCEFAKFHPSHINSMEVRLAARLHEFGMLPNQIRERLVEQASRDLLEGTDCSALNDKGVQLLFTNDEMDSLLLKAKDELIPNLSDVREGRESGYDSEENPDQYMQSLFELFGCLRDHFGDCQDLVARIEREENLTSQWVADNTPDESDDYQRDLDSAEAAEGPEGERSIFDDIDEYEGADRRAQELTRLPKSGDREKTS